MYCLVNCILANSTSCRYSIIIVMLDRVFLANSWGFLVRLVSMYMLICVCLVCVCVCVCVCSVYVYMYVCMCVCVGRWDLECPHPHL